MEKIIINKQGSITAIDTDTNSILKEGNFYSSGWRDVCYARNNGLVITPTEVIDIKAGDVILSYSFYSHKESKNIVKVLVISDPTVLYDLRQLDELEKEHEKKD